MVSSILTKSIEPADPDDFVFALGTETFTREPSEPDDFVCLASVLTESREPQMTLSRRRKLLSELLIKSLSEILRTTDYQW